MARKASKVRGGSGPETGKRRLRRPRVEVVAVGEGLGLRVDGTFASYYRPGCPTTGSVWDALAVPLLALPPARRRRALILGLGGASAARLMRALAPDIEIVGVEFDPDVVEAARQWLGLAELGLEVVVGDAKAFLERDRRRYDVVVDDVFVGEGRAVHKPSWLPHPGHGLAARRVAAGGLLVSNTLDEAAQVARGLGALFPRVVRIEIEDYDNRVFAAGPETLSAGALRDATARNPILRDMVSKLHFRGVRKRAR